MLLTRRPFTLTLILPSVSEKLMYCVFLDAASSHALCAYILPAYCGLQSRDVALMAEGELVPESAASGRRRIGRLLFPCCLQLEAFKPFVYMAHCQIHSFIKELVCKWATENSGLCSCVGTECQDHKCSVWYRREDAINTCHLSAIWICGSVGLDC